MDPKRIAELSLGTDYTQNKLLVKCKDVGGRGWGKAHSQYSIAGKFVSREACINLCFYSPVLQLDFIQLAKTINRTLDNDNTKVLGQAIIYTAHYYNAACHDIQAHKKMEAILTRVPVGSSVGTGRPTVHYGTRRIFQMLGMFFEVSKTN